MEPERWQQIERVVQRALDREEAARETYLDEACAGDPQLREEVEALLGFDRKAESFLDAPAVEWAGVELGDEGMVGRVIGAYRIEALLGEGGMGAVYRARDERLGRAVAIKAMRESGDRGLLRRFTQEARLASALNHPNIVTVYDLLETDGAPLLVTEYVEGGSLRARIGDGMKTEDAVEVARQVASALGAAHGAGIVHRDVKPENVMVRADGLVKVLDFGIAKPIEGAWPGGVGVRGDEQEIATDVMTAPGVMVGTVSYMSPEQARGESVDGRTDVWGLGVMLYEMVAGHRPFRGASRVDVLAAVMTKDPEPVESMPGALADVVGRALRKRADERYATAAEMAEALDGLKGTLANKGETDGGEGTTAKYAVATKEQTAAPTNLPAEREALIGRDRERRAVVEELRQTRLLTVTGPGGTGKTRLAADAGRALLHEFEDGVYFVELAAIRDPGLVASAVAQVLGVKEGSGSLEETLALFLGEREVLLVLDNFEQVVEAGPLVARLLASAPRVKLLVTSRERLHVSAEREFALSPLSLPPDGGAATSQELESFGAVALFVERARVVRPDFALDAQSEANRGAVAEICRRLDGLPLAIELAAARMRLLTPETLLGRLDRQLKLLTGGARDLPERQQTMRAAIAWSYDLLEEDERRLFEWLSVFSGGWTLEAAEALDADSDVLELLTQLADKSLVVVESRGEDVRYRMLETIRQFAAEQLSGSGKEAKARAAHGAWLLEFAAGRAREHRGQEQTLWFATLDRELENFRAALEWSEGGSDTPEIALRLLTAMGPYWEARGRWSEGRERLERALAVSRDLSSQARATALYYLGGLARWQSDHERARELVAESLEMYRKLDDRTGAGMALGELGGITARLGDVEAADAMLREGLAEYDRPEDTSVRASLLVKLGGVAYDRKAFDEYTACHEEALTLSRQLGNRGQVAAQLYNLGILAELRGEWDRAAELLEEGLALAREVDERPLVARMIHYLGKVAGGKGEYGRAAALRAEAAREYLAIGDRNMLQFLLDEVTSELFRRRHAERGARLAGAIRRLEEAGELPLLVVDPLEDENLTAAREALGEVEAEAAMAKGRRLSLDEALELAFAD